MLRELLEQHYPKKPQSYKLPDQFSPVFTKALAQDAEMDGILDEANAIVLEKITQNEALNQRRLDDTWGEGVTTGYGLGIKEGKTVGRNRGLVEGLLAGWNDAATFKKPNRVYDLNTPSIKPIAEGGGAKELGENIEDTRENRYWRTKTDHMKGKAKGWSLGEWQEGDRQAFIYHQDHNRLGLNLNKFMEPGDDLEGLEVRMLEKGQNKPKKVKMKKNEVVERAVGTKAYPRKTPPIPPRPKHEHEPPRIKEGFDEGDIEEVPSPAKPAPPSAPKKKSPQQKKPLPKIVPIQLELTDDKPKKVGK